MSQAYLTGAALIGRMMAQRKALDEALAEAELMERVHVIDAGSEPSTGNRAARRRAAARDRKRR